MWRLLRLYSGFVPKTARRSINSAEDQKDLNSLFTGNELFSALLTFPDVLPFHTALLCTQVWSKWSALGSSVCCFIIFLWYRHLSRRWILVRFGCYCGEISAKYLEKYLGFSLFCCCFFATLSVQALAPQRWECLKAFFSPYIDKVLSPSPLLTITTLMRCCYLS